MTTWGRMFGNRCAKGCVRRVGAQCSRSPCRSIQRVDGRSIRCAAWGRRACGIFSSRLDKEPFIIRNKKRDRDHLVLKTTRMVTIRNAAEPRVIVFGIDDYTWGDQAWMKAGERTNPIAMSIYEVISVMAKDRNREDGIISHTTTGRSLHSMSRKWVTHIELCRCRTSVRSFVGYQVRGLLRAEPPVRHAADFQYFVDYMHRQDIGVIMDGPGIFPKTLMGWRISTERTCMSTGPAEGEHKDWGTLIFNFGSMR